MLASVSVSRESSANGSLVTSPASPWRKAVLRTAREATKVRKATAAVATRALKSPPASMSLADTEVALAGDSTAD